MSCRSCGWDRRGGRRRRAKTTSEAPGTGRPPCRRRKRPTQRRAVPFTALAGTQPCRHHGPVELDRVGAAASGRRGTRLDSQTGPPLISRWPKRQRLGKAGHRLTGFLIVVLINQGALPVAVERSDRTETPVPLLARPAVAAFAAKAMQRVVALANSRASGRGSQASWFARLPEYTCPKRELTIPTEVGPARAVLYLPAGTEGTLPRRSTSTSTAAATSCRRSSWTTRCAGA